MGILSSIFGNSKPTPESQYETLRDDGVRAMQMGEAAYAEKCLKAALDIKRELRTVSFLAEVYLRMQNYEQALPLLQEISTSDEDTLEVDLLLAQTQGKLGQYANERETCQRITQQHADEPRALYLMAEATTGCTTTLWPLPTSHNASPCAATTNKHFFCEPTCSKTCRNGTRC